MTIYLDNGATTKLDPEAVHAMHPYFTEKYGNASSSHHKGQEAKMALNEDRHIIAKSIGAKDEEIIFTSGGTEANNFTIKGIAWANKDKGRHIITTKIEHDCILNACKWLETQGFKVTYLGVDSEGFVNYPLSIKGVRFSAFFIEKEEDRASMLKSVLASVFQTFLRT